MSHVATAGPPVLEITASVLVQAGPDRVWQLAMDWARQEDWMFATRVQGGQGAGAAVVARTGFGPAASPTRWRSPSGIRRAGAWYGTPAAWSAASACSR